MSRGVRHSNRRKPFLLSLGNHFQDGEMVLMITLTFFQNQLQFVLWFVNIRRTDIFKCEAQV